MEQIIKFDASITELKPLNESFSLAKCRVFYTGINRNFSHISRECAEEMAKTIAYTPVVGEWKEDIENFGGHGGKITIKDGQVTYEDTTKPYGCVLDVPVWWETVTEDDGTEREYMCCYLVLWTTRYPEAMKVIEEDSYQSMEISVDEGYSKDGIYYIDKATFLGLCILGKDDDNPENTTEPCFESSTIETANFEALKDNFRKEFNLMIKDLKQNLLDDTSIFNKVEREVKEHMEKEPIKEPVKDKQDFALSVQQIYTSIDKALSTRTIMVEDWWGDSVEEKEFYSIDLIPDEKIVIVIDNATWSNYFGLPYNMNGDIAELDYENMKPYMRGEWREVKEGESVPSPVNFSKVKEAFEKRMKDFSNKAVEKAKAEFNIKDTEDYKSLEAELNTTKKQFNKAIEGADESLKIENEKLKVDYSELKEECDGIKANLETKEGEYAKLSTDFSVIKEDNEKLLEFKENAEKEARVSLVDKEIAEFSLEEAETKEMRERAYNAEISIEELRKELFALEGMKAHQKKEMFSKVESKKEVTTIKVIPTTDEKHPYGSLMTYFK